MLINLEKKFLFIHIQKTAGTSISRYLKTIEGTKFEYNQHSFINVVDFDMSDLFKFCFVRNPFERLVSWFNMLDHNRKFQKKDKFLKYITDNSTTFSEFLNLTEIILDDYDNYSYRGNIDYPKSIKFNQLDYITDSNGHIAVDFIGRLENINDDFNFILDKIGQPLHTLEKRNSFNRDHYRSYYTDEDIEKVYKMCKRDIEYFKYEF
jgi:chondroitin 4-sulfotransferase 11